LGFQLGAAIRGGLTIVIATAIVAWSNGATWPVSFMLVALGLVTFYAVLFTRETATRPMRLMKRRCVLGSRWGYLVEATATTEAPRSQARPSAWRCCLKRGGCTHDPLVTAGGQDSDKADCGRTRIKASNGDHCAPLRVALCCWNWRRRS